ncbi:MAG: aspartate/methionine/tyrosine aminotransferase [Myxococcota bacterium]|jgi:aspartate/methionine/tyrosine aminotransferase
MDIAEFALERWYARFEFSVRYNLSASDCETISVGELLDLAGTDLTSLLDLRLGYTESAGHPALREAISALYPGLATNDILTTAAPEEGIFLAMHALLSPGDRVVVMTPCYQSLREVATSIGCAIDPWPLRLLDGRWSADLDALADILEGAALLVVNAPHNPTGYLPDQAQWQAIADLAAAKGVRIFSDEMYRGLERAPEHELPPMASRVPGALSLWGLSKSFGLPGLRVGWLACTDASVLARIAHLKDYTTICSSAPSEHLALSALTARETLFRRARTRVESNLTYIRALAERRPRAVAWLEPDAGPIGLLRVHGEMATTLSQRARETAGVLVAPSHLFGLPDNMVRIGLGRANTPAAIEALEGSLRA